VRKLRIGTRIAGLLLSFAAALAQSPPPRPATPITTAQITFPVFTLNPVPASGAALAVVGQQGLQTVYYWIATNYTVGSANLAGPFPITNAPNVLSGSNYVTITPIFPAGSGPASYDLVKTSTPIMPSGACACAVATGVSVGSITNDQSNSTNSYTVTTFNLTPLTMTMQNEVQSAGVAHLILRQNGVFVADLSTGLIAPQYAKLRCESGLGDGLNAMAAGTYLQTFCYNDSGVTWTITGVKCFTDNSGTSTLNATNGAGTGLLTGAVTCSTAFAAGTQSATTTIASGDFVKFTFAADGTSKQSTWVVSMTQ
jgi:hypothetical protein